MPVPGKLVTNKIRSGILGHMDKYIHMEKNHRAAVKKYPASELTATPGRINKQS